MRWPVCLTRTKTLRINLYNAFGRCKFNACNATIALEKLSVHAVLLSERGCTATAYSLTTCHKQMLENWRVQRAAIEPELETASREKMVEWVRVVEGYSQAFCSLPAVDTLIAESEAEASEELQLRAQVAELKALIDAHATIGNISPEYDDFIVPGSDRSIIMLERHVEVLRETLSMCEVGAELQNYFKNT